MSQILGTTAIAETVGWTINQDVYGLDVLTRNFEGPAADWPRWRRTMKDASPDYLYKDYFLVNITAGSRRGEVITPVATYKGCPGLSLNIPAFSLPAISKALVTKQVTCKLGDGSGKTVELWYKAPSTTWSYARGSEPTEPLHMNELRPFRQSFKIIKARGATNYPIEFVTGLRSPELAANPKYYVAAEVYNEQFDAKQEGKAWTVTERNDGVLYDIGDVTRSDFTALMIGQQPQATQMPTQN